MAVSWLKMASLEPETAYLGLMMAKLESLMAISNCSLGRILSSN